MASELKIHFSRGSEYDKKVEIDIRLKNKMSSPDYKTVIEASETITTIVAKYLPKEELKK